MSTNVDKSLNRAPLGMSADTPEEEGDDFEVEIDLEEGEEDEEGEEEEEDDGFNDNLAEELDESVLSTLVSDLLADFEDDISSRKDWIQTYVDGLELLGLKTEDRTEPWPGASGAS